MMIIAPILMRFSRRFVSDQLSMPSGTASARRKIARLYASVRSYYRMALAANEQHDSRDHFVTFLPFLIHYSAVPCPS